MVSVVLTLTSTGAPPSSMSPGLTTLKSLPCFRGDSRDAHLSDWLSLMLITSSSFVFSHKKVSLKPGESHRCSSSNYRTTALPKIQWKRSFPKVITSTRVFELSLS